MKKQRKVLKKIAKTVTDGLGGHSIFGVELFVKGDEVFFSEVSPRPHDTGMVTMITQSQSEFALHVRAVLGLPLDYIDYGAGGASAAYKAKDDTFNPAVKIKKSAFTRDSYVRVFGKPQSHEGRRMAVALTFDKDSSTKALEKAKDIIKKNLVTVNMKKNSFIIYIFSFCSRWMFFSPISKPFLKR